MLIQKMLGIQRVDDLVFAEYSHRTGGTVALLIKADNGFYDFSNKEFITAQAINYTRPFRYYISIDGEYISKRKAKKLAEMHYEEFFREYKLKFMPKQNVLLDTDKTFKFYHIC